MQTARRFFSRWQNWLGIMIVLLFVLAALFAPLLSPPDPENPGPVKIIPGTRVKIPRPPSPEAPLGTLSNQASVYHSLIWGTRQVVGFGVTTTGIIFALGTLVGTLSAFLGKRMSAVLMWITDSFLSFPVIGIIVLLNQLVTIKLFNLAEYVEGQPMFFLLKQDLPAVSKALIIAADFIQKVTPITLAFIFLLWTPYARVMFASVSRLKQSDFVIAAKTSGVRQGRIIRKYLIPNAITPVLVLAAKDVGALVVLQTTFAFIGLGGNNVWAEILVRGRDWIYSPMGIVTYWWVFLPVTLALILFGIGWNIIGDGLNDALNPRNMRY